MYRLAQGMLLIYPIEPTIKRVKTPFFMGCFDGTIAKTGKQLLMSILRKK